MGTLDRSTIANLAEIDGPSSILLAGVEPAQLSDNLADVLL